MSVSEPISHYISYVDGAARFRDLIYLVGRNRRLAQEDVEHSLFIGFYRGEYGSMENVNWSAVAVCVPRRPVEQMVAVGEDGEVFTYVGGVSAQERIKPEPLALRNLGVIDGLAYACGMGRQVFRRDGVDDWVAMHAPETTQTAGFEAIDGFSADEIYAVGWNGEIWQWGNGSWTSHDTPVEVVLTGVCCADDGQVYACGQDGTLLIGRNGMWRQVPATPPIDFWDVHWYDGRVFLASMQRLYTCDSEGNLAPVDFGPDAPSWCYRLSSAEGVLWSVGNSDVFSFDGRVWQRVD